MVQNRVDRLISIGGFSRNSACLIHMVPFPLSIYVLLQENLFETNGTPYKTAY